MDLSTLSFWDAGIVIVLATGALGSVKLVYAHLAARAGLMMGPKVHRGLNRIAGMVMICVGVLLSGKG